MGQRKYIGMMSNEKYERIKDLKHTSEIMDKLNLIPTNRDYDEDLDYLYGGDFCDEYFEIGDFFIPEDNAEGCSKFFSIYEHSFDNLTLINDDIFKKIILEHEKKPQERYRELLEPFLDKDNFFNNKFFDNKDGIVETENLTKLYELVRYVYMKAVDMGAITLFEKGVESKLNFDKDTEHLKHTSFYEYDVLNLLSWYKRIDWDNNKIFFIGW